jgi:hypothetical protein
MADVAAPMHVARQRYLVAPAALARPKGSNLKKIGAMIIKIINKKGLKKKSAHNKTQFL